MTNIRNGFDPQTQQDVPQDHQANEAGGGRTLLLLGVLAITGAAWWTMQDRNDSITTAPPFASAEPLPAPIDEAVVATAPETNAKPVSRTPTLTRGNREASLIASSQVMPKYPASALRSGDTGTVLVLATVDRNGVPTEVTLDDRSGNRELDRSALQAVRQWRFQPALRDGKPVTATVRVPVEFALQNG